MNGPPRTPLNCSEWGSGREGEGGAAEQRRQKDGGGARAGGGGGVGGREIAKSKSGVDRRGGRTPF